MTLVLGSGVEEVRRLAVAFGAELTAVPDDVEALDGWRDAEKVGPPVDEVVVAVWLREQTQQDLAATGYDAWVERCEVPLARWWAAMGVAARRCADGGAVVAVVERPPPLDVGDWAPAAAVADAAENLARSLARAEGGRGVRVNAVTTPVRLHRPPLVDPQPSLATYPGRVDREVVGAVRMLLGDDAAGVTGTVVHADGGRSWR